MLLLATEHEMWGICLPPESHGHWSPARQAPERAPSPLDEPRYGASCMTSPRPQEPIMLPPWGSQAWEKWEPVIRRTFCERRPYFAADYLRSRVLHPEDSYLIEAARLIHNGDMPEPEGPASAYPRAWCYEGLHRWWVLELPAHLTHEHVRRVMREQIEQRQD